MLRVTLVCVAIAAATAQSMGAGKDSVHQRQLAQKREEEARKAREEKERIKQEHENWKEYEKNRLRLQEEQPAMPASRPKALACDCELRGPAVR